MTLLTIKEPLQSSLLSVFLHCNPTVFRTRTVFTPSQFKNKGPSFFTFLYSPKMVIPIRRIHHDYYHNLMWGHQAGAKHTSLVLFEVKEGASEQAARGHTDVHWNTLFSRLKEDPPPSANQRPPNKRNGTTTPRHTTTTAIQRENAERTKRQPTVCWWCCCCCLLLQLLCGGRRSQRVACYALTLPKRRCYALGENIINT